MLSLGLSEAKGMVIKVKNIVLFDTSIATMNQGDNIIMQSVLDNIKNITEGNFVVKYPTHTPCFHFYQETKLNARYKFIDSADLKIICGTNIIQNKIETPWHFWNINIFNCAFAKNSILLGVGSGGFKSNDIKLYPKILYKKILSKNYFHSTRDEVTAEIIRELGLKAINTGCPTVWKLTKEHCDLIPIKKAPNVVFTLTDYSESSISDKTLVEILLRNYEKVYYWPQGSKDYNYIKTFPCFEQLNIISPDINSFSNVLSGNIDYIGTRLHAGIFAMQHGVRSIIIKVDNRARDMEETYNLNCIERDEIVNLEDMINNDLKTNVSINTDSINQWLSQF